MLVPVTSFDAFGEEYDHITEQAAFNEISEAEETSAADETTVPEEPFVPVETTISEEVITPEETTVPEEVIAPEETTVPEETTYPEEPEFSEEEIVYDEEINLLADHVHQFHRWEQTEYDHWRVCTVCKLEFDRDSHDYAIKVVNTTKTSA